MGIIRRTSIGAVVGMLLLALLSPVTMSQAAVTTPVSDSFDRNVAVGWGSAPTGGKWILDSREGSAVDGARGSLLVPGGSKRSAYLPTDISGDSRTTATFSFPVLPDAAPGVRAGLTVRREGDSYFLAGLRVLPGGQVLLSLSAVSEPFLNSRLTFERYIGSIEEGGSVTISTAVTESPGLLIRAKAWTTGGTEPAEFQVSGGSSAVPSTGFVGVLADAANEASGTVLQLDSIQVEQGEPDAPVNQGPDAVFSYALDYRTITVDAKDSLDPDGSIVNYVWNYGDGDEGVGVTDTHVYNEPGTYTVTLTVTDDKGATDTATQEIVIAEYQPPNAASTGVPDGKEAGLKLASSTALPYPNDTITSTRLTINTPGAVYDGWRFDRLVDVKARGVIIRNSYFEGINGNPKDSALVRVLNDRTNNQVPSAVVEDSTLIPKYPNDTIDGARGSNFTLKRVEIAYTVDGLQIYGASGDYEDPYAGNVLVESSWIHDLQYYDNDSHVDGTHNDAIQIRGGRNITLFASRVDGPMNGANMQITQPQNRVADITVVGNQLAGGGCTINVYDGQGPGPIEGMTVVLNGFVRGTTANPNCAIIMSERTTLVSSVDFNAWTDGTLPPPAVKKGRLCFGYEWDEELEQFRPAPCIPGGGAAGTEAGDQDPGAGDPGVADPAADPASDLPGAGDAPVDVPADGAPADGVPADSAPADSPAPGDPSAGDAALGEPSASAVQTAPVRLGAVILVPAGRAPVPV